MDASKEVASSENTTLPQEGNKKRPRSALASNNIANVDIINTDSKMEIMNEGETPPSNRPRVLNGESIRRMKLEAIFHPKFENENQHDPQIRKNMLDKVAQKQGVLEVSLKHSGSLLLWSGGKRFYSKNGTDNVFTHVGEILLRQHVARAWMDDEGNNDIDYFNEEAKFRECSHFVESNRLTLSFEVVTSVLGHHGDIPKKDFLILIAVGDRTEGTFYSTTQIMQLAQRFRLPHNDVWIYKSLSSANRLFELYDTCRETGLAEDVIETLSQTADGGHMMSLCPHTIFQGNILEGIVIRYIRINNDTDQQYLDEVCDNSAHILNAVPPEKKLEIPFEQQVEPSGPMYLLQTKIRETFDENDATKAASIVGAIITKSNHRNDMSRTTSKLNKKEIDLPSVALKLLEDTTIDIETREICILIKTMDELKLSVSYHLIAEHHESVDGTYSAPNRFLCIVHILHDSCHKKYHIATSAKGGGMTLFRGFSIELSTSESSQEDDTINPNLNSKMDMVRLQSETIDDAKLILKMKFLPYMVRTFICRNGMSILAKKGRNAFNEYAYNQFQKWGMSDKAMNTWMDLFNAWGFYYESPSKKDSKGKSLPALNSANYLYHFYHFQSLHSSNFFNNIGTQESSKFFGLAVIVGLNKDKIKDVALRLNEHLECSKISTNINGLNETDVALSLQNKGGGIICAAEVTEGFKNLRSLARRYQDNIYLVLIGCSKDEIEASFVGDGNPNSKHLKKTVGISNGWKKCRVSVSLEIPNSSLAADFGKDNDLQRIVNQLKDASASSKPDTKPGVLVFFPTIPGCGKSSLCSEINSDIMTSNMDRILNVVEGDKTAGKFWPQALQRKIKQPSSIFVADKNCPPNGWYSIHNICEKTHGIAVCVLPDNKAFEDTTVVCQDESSTLIKHRFPFSLAFLAVCMSRVLHRNPDSHNGKLDSATKEACMIVVKFFCLYRTVSVSSMLEQMSKLGQGNNKIITVPFFNKTIGMDMPIDLKEALENAIRVQIQHDVERKVSCELLSVEKKLRNVIMSHQGYISSLAADEKESKESFISQLRDIALSLGDTFEERSDQEDIESGTIKIVSLDCNRQEVNSVLDEIAHCNDLFNNFLHKHDFDTARNTKMNDDVKKGDRFINNTHCTFAHTLDMTQQAIKQKFDKVIGLCCEICVNAVLFNDDVAALEVSIPSCIDSTPIPQPCNTFPHITVWCRSGVKALTSNELPEKVYNGTARRIPLDSPCHIKGHFRYWYS